MANGETFKEIKEALEKDPASLSTAMRDRLVLAGMIELYAKVEKIEKDSQPLQGFYRAAVGISAVFTTALVSLLWGIFTGQIQVIFP